MKDFIHKVNKMGMEFIHGVMEDLMMGNGQMGISMDMESTNTQPMENQRQDSGKRAEENVGL